MKVRKFCWAMFLLWMFLAAVECYLGDFKIAGLSFVVALVFLFKNLKDS